jgi:hypothetical protein
MRLGRWVPFTLCSWRNVTSGRERVKRTPRSPLQSAAPQNRCFALDRLPPPMPAVSFDSRYSPTSWGSPFGPTRCVVQNRSGRFCPVSLNLSPPSRQPDLAIGSSSDRFRGLNPLAARSAPGAQRCRWLSCGKTSQPWLTRLKTFTVSTLLP